jgi:hypothetical protein
MEHVAERRGHGDLVGRLLSRFETGMRHAVARHGQLWHLDEVIELVETPQ